MPVAVVVRAALCLYAGGAGGAVESQPFSSVTSAR